MSARDQGTPGSPEERPTVSRAFKALDLMARLSTSTDELMMSALNLVTVSTELAQFRVKPGRECVDLGVCGMQSRNHARLSRPTTVIWSLSAEIRSVRRASSCAFNLSNSARNSG